MDFCDLGKYRENNRIEAKRAQGGLPKSLWETYSSFANTYGGILLLGVAEQGDKTFASVPLANPQALVDEFWRIVNDPNLVSANILAPEDVRIVESGGNPIVAITVPRAPRQLRPIYIGQSAFGGTYRRSGEGDYRCNADEVCALLRDQANQEQDLQLINRLDATALSVETLTRYRQYLPQKGKGLEWSALGDEALLRRLGALAPDGQGVLRPTLAGLLAFGQGSEIRAQLPGYQLEYREIPATGSAPTYVLSSQEPHFTGNLFDFYHCIVQRWAQPLPGPLRQPQPHQDQSLNQAFREALANALIHADYRDEQGLLVERFPDRLVVSNPGGFRVDIHRAPWGGRADARNPALANIFHLAGIGKRRGKGLPGIHALWRSRGWAPPSLQEQISPARSILTLPLSSLPKQERWRMGALEYLTDHVTAAPRDLCLPLGITAAQARRLLQKLEEEGLAVAQGSGRRREYRLRA